MMKSLQDKLAIAAGIDTEELVNFIFRELPDAEVDQIELERLSAREGGVARELVTTGAILTLGSTLALGVLRLIERWLEVKRQRDAVEIIYEAAKVRPDVVGVLAELEKHHANIATASGRISTAWVNTKGKRN